MRRFLFLGFAFAILACSKTQKPTALQYLELTDLITDTLYLEKDTLTKELGSAFAYFETDSGQVLLTFRDNRLLFYSFPDGRLIKTQSFEREGPDGIGAFVTGNFIDTEAIFFLSQQKELVKANFNGKVIQRWKFPDVPAERLYRNYSSYLFNKIQRLDENLYFIDIPFVFLESFADYEMWGIVFDTKKELFENFSFKYPKEILQFTNDDQLGLFSHALNTDTKEHLVSFSISDSLLLIKNGKPTWHYAGTVEKLKFLKGKTTQQGEYTVFNPNHESSKYESLDIDTHSKKILRTVRIKGPTIENPDQKKHRLLVFDYALSAEAELEFNTDQIGFYGFNTPKGYAVLLRTKTTDDLVAFAILDFSKINP
ncbi:MAG: DUF4221 family protein [Algoriphagus sp.]|uniref:DUF4221 family protein n=2 Tax=Algoriphagus sp. TaxID=1872435 RepID=UPI00272FE7D3|nr:DUF4221 family protein [Algoriphagus sp.]MDP2041950.1 DUF4221 family protein [Algoriphagus sp.]MDP3474137.1 DUF4221 family protein [Algoriphagus sp.]